MTNSVPTKRTRFRKRHRILLALASTLVALFIAEAVVRTLNLAPRVFPTWLSSERTAYQRSENPILGYDLKANYRDSQADTHESFPSTNSHGLRDVERTLRKEDGVTRVVLLGDSVVAGHGILDLEDTISQQLERRLSDQRTAGQETSDRQIEVLNFGIGGYCTRAEVELLKTRALAFNPDLVILLFVANDYEDFNGQIAHYAELPPLFIRQLFLRSHLFRVACLKLNLYPNWLGQPETNHREAIGRSNVEEGLQILSELSSDNDVRSVIVFWPEFGDDGITDSFRIQAEEFARQESLPVHSIADQFIEQLQDQESESNPRLRYTIGDTMHPNSVGTSTAAAALEEIVRMYIPE
jgi:lysophospholipase L1-like esterase